MEHSTQEVGTQIDLPRIYSRYAIRGFSYGVARVVGKIRLWERRIPSSRGLTNSDTYGSYASSGMYGNHASINYVFGQLGTRQNKPNNVQI